MNFSHHKTWHILYKKLNSLINVIMLCDYFLRWLFDYYGNSIWILKIITNCKNKLLQIHFKSCGTIQYFKYLLRLFDFHYWVKQNKGLFKNVHWCKNLYTKLFWNYCSCNAFTIMVFTDDKQKIVLFYIYVYCSRF